MTVSAEAPFPSLVELVLGAHAPLVDARRASALALEAAVGALSSLSQASKARPSGP